MSQTKLAIKLLNISDPVSAQIDQSARLLIRFLFSNLNSKEFVKFCTLERKTKIKYLEKILRIKLSSYMNVYNPQDQIKIEYRSKFSVVSKFYISVSDAPIICYILTDFID